MGDKANIAMKQKDGNFIYLYSHYDGFQMPKILQNALIRGVGRWDDEPYLSRIIFCELVKDSFLDTTGYGITTYMTDNEHPVIFVDAVTKKVYFKAFVAKDKKDSWDFQEFIKLDIDENFEEY